MKTTIYLIAGILMLLILNSANSQDVTYNNAGPKKGSIAISCTPDLHSLALQWANEYTSLNPEVKIKVISASDKSANLGDGENVSFISSQPQAAITNKTNWKMVIGRDVIVPVINSGNPYMTQLMSQGVSQKKFTRLLNCPEKQNWGTLLGDNQNKAAHIYVVNDETVKSGVANFLQSVQIPATGITFGTKDEVVFAIQNDPLAIGFCNVVSLYNQGNQAFIADIKMLPIDKNGNGTIDYMEDIYSDPNTLLRGVWIGKYPKSLYSNIYAISKIQPTNESEIAFLSWVLTEGQQYLNANGYCNLTNSESQSQLEKFNVAAISIQPVEKSSNAGIVLLVVAMFITLGLIVSAGVRKYRKQAIAVPDFNDSLTGFNENSVEVPKGVYFNRSHSWAFMEKDGNISIGIDDFLQHVTGPLTRVEMRNPGEKVKKGELLFSIVQFGKRLSLYSPISGIIKQQNSALTEDGSRINASPYSEGWIYRIEPSNWFEELRFMDMAEKYKKWINTEFSRMKDFLAATLKPDSLEYSHVVLQDGGIVKDGVLADFGPEVWDDFQTNFLEIYK